MENDDEPIPPSSLYVQTSGDNIDGVENFMAHNDADANGDSQEDISPFDTSTSIVQKPKARKAIIRPVQKVNHVTVTPHDVTLRPMLNQDIAPTVYRYVCMYAYMYVCMYVCVLIRIYLTSQTNCIKS